MTGMKRRQALTGLAATAISGTGLMWILSSETQAADISFGSLSIPNTDQFVADGDVSDVQLDLSCKWEFDGNKAPSDAKIRLRGGVSSTDTSTLSTKQIDGPYQTQMSGQTDIQTSVLNASSLDAETFEPVSQGNTQETTVYLKLILELTQGQEVKQVATASAIPTVAVTWGDISVSGKIGATGEITVQS
jgi:hypothetical protein